MSRPYILSETNWKEVKSTQYEVAILCWGATEAHNYHLPYATDNYQCDFIVAEAARQAWDNGCKVIVLPTIPLGVNTGQLDVKLDLNLNPSTQMAILDDIADTIERSDIPKLVVMNGHGGNNFKQMIREVGQNYPDIMISTFNWFSVDNGKDIFNDLGEHAGEMETSLMMHFLPDLVSPLTEAGDGANKKFKFTAMREGWAWAEREWSKVTEDTGIGNPKAASAEKGKAYFEKITKKIANYFVELSQVSNNELFE
jgi:creatinine amidohydrolase